MSKTNEVKNYIVECNRKYGDGYATERANKSQKKSMMGLENYIVECKRKYGDGYAQSLNHKGEYTFADATERASKSQKKSMMGLDYRAVRALPQSTDPIAILESARKYLGDQPYWGNYNPMSYSEWYNALGDARGILYVALTDIAAEREPEVPVSRRKIINSDFTTILRPFPKPSPAPDAARLLPSVTVVFVDLISIENRLLRNSINDWDVQKLLPFQTTLGTGNNHVHIVNASAYDVKTSTHVILEGDTICARSGGVKWHLADLRDSTAPTCPGCIEKGKGVIIEHLRQTAGL